MQAVMIYCGLTVSVAILYAGWAVNKGLRAIAAALAASTKEAGEP